MRKDSALHEALADIEAGLALDDLPKSPVVPYLISISAGEKTPDTLLELHGEIYTRYVVTGELPKL